MAGSGGSRQAIAAITQQFLNAAVSERSGAPVELFNPNFTYMVEDTIIERVDVDKQTVLALRDTLDKLKGTPLNEHGDTYIMDDSHHLMIKVALQPGKPAAYAISTTTFVSMIRAAVFWIVSIRRVIIAVPFCWPA
jgi:hypothetical protein